MAGLFERLNEGRTPLPRAPPTKKATKQPRKRADLVTQWEKDVEIKAFLMDLLSKGPVSAATVQKRGAEHGFTKMRLWRAKRLIGVASFKKGMGFDSRWFWTLPKNAPGSVN